MCERCDNIVTELSYLEHVLANELSAHIQENRLMAAAEVQIRLKAYTHVRRMISHEHVASSKAP